MTATGWVTAGSLRVGDRVQVADGGGSSRARFAGEDEARAAGGDFLRIERLERTGPDHAIPNARGETHVWFEDGDFRRWPDEARVLVVGR